MSDLKEKRVELILQQLEELPTLPAVAVRLLEVTSNDNSNVEEVVRLISSDPSLTARLLQLVHRADVGVRGEVNSVERTVVGLDHMVVGKRLAERWQLPSIVRDCAWLHGQSPEALPATVKQPRLVSLVTLADTLVREQHLGYSGNYTFNVPRQALLDA